MLSALILQLQHEINGPESNEKPKNNWPEIDSCLNISLALAISRGFK